MVALIWKDPLTPRWCRLRREQRSWPGFNQICRASQMRFACCRWGCRSRRGFRFCWSKPFTVDWGELGLSATKQKSQKSRISQIQEAIEIHQQLLGCWTALEPVVSPKWIDPLQGQSLQMNLKLPLPQSADGPEQRIEGSELWTPLQKHWH
jgi:hypothetical protein